MLFPRCAVARLLRRRETEKVPVSGRPRRDPRGGAGLAGPGGLRTARSCSHRTIAGPDARVVAGRRPRPLTTLTNGEIPHRFPQVLPGGRAVLFTASTEANIEAGSTLVAQHLPSGARRPSFAATSPATWQAATLYMQATTFCDALRPSAVGGDRPGWRFDSVKTNAARGSAQFAVSSTGTMVYVSGGTRSAEADDVDGSRRQVGGFAPNRPSGSTRSFRRTDATSRWTSALPGTATSGCTLGAGHADPRDDRADERRIPRVDAGGHASSTVSTGRPPIRRIHQVWKRADGAGDAQVLVRGPSSDRARGIPTSSCSRMPRHGPDDDDVMILPSRATTPAAGSRATDGVRERRRPGARAGLLARRQVAGLYIQREGASKSTCSRFPGRARGSSSRGRRSVVVPHPPRVGVHGARGRLPPYNVDRPLPCRERTFQVEAPRPWAAGATWLPELSGYRMYAPHPDGARVAMAPPSETDADAASHMTLVLNLFDELRRSTPVAP